MEKIQVIFDFDGTVIDSTAFVLEGVAYALKEVTGKDYDFDFLKKTYEANFLKFMDNLELDRNNMELRQNLFTSWSRHSVQSPFTPTLFEGIKTVIETLRSEDHDVHLWTARDRASAIDVIKSHNIGHLFTEVRCGDDGPTKPNPWGLEDIMKGESPSNCVVIGDSDTDFHGAKDFGAHFIAAGWCPLAKPDRLVELGAKTVLKNPLELEEAIKRIR